MIRWQLNPKALVLGLGLCLALLGGCASTPPQTPSGKPERNAQQPERASAADRQKFQQALADIKSGHLQQAQTKLQSLVADQPGLAAAQNNLGVAYRRAGEFQKAKAAYEAALAADPDNRNAHLNLGILYDVYLQQPEQALAHYQRYQALSDQPDKEVSLWIADLKQRL